MYKLIGADQKEYGPVTADGIRNWIMEGRANGQTLGRIEGGPWKALSTFPEFAQALSALPQPPPMAPVAAGSLRGKYNGMAVAGLIMGLLSVTVGLLCCGPLLGILGILFSAVALSQIKRNPLHQSSRGMAIAGLILSALGMIISLFILLAFGFWKHLIETIQTRNRP
jgi:hypothetical protein